MPRCLTWQQISQSFYGFALKQNQTRRIQPNEPDPTPKSNGPGLVSAQQYREDSRNEIAARDADSGSGRHQALYRSRECRSPEQGFAFHAGRDYPRAHIDRIHAGDYFGLLTYIPMFQEYEDQLPEICKQIVEGKQVARVLGFGPRFLHRTGQAYQGGPNSGAFLQINL